jgi:hypothetical protein
MWPDGFPRPTSAHTQIFMGTVGDQAIGPRDWFTFQKKPGVSWYFILAVGGGGGGGRSNNGSVTIAAGGGGSGALSRLLIPAFVLPDTFYIHPGRGGRAQTTANFAGNGGLASWVAIAPSTGAPAAQTAILLANGGSGGAGAASTAGAAGAAATATSAMFQNYGIPVWIAGQAGTAGSATTSGAVTAITPFSSSGIPVSGGAGGGNASAVGGNINAIAGLNPIISGGAAATGNPGRDGISQALLNWGPKSGALFSTGGAGGGGNGAAAAGNGGNGGPGSGGGGGGSCNNAAGTSGDGGAGGPGFVIVMGF